MSKLQALGWAIVCGVIAICCHAIGLSYFDAAALIGSIGFLLLFLSKVWRDSQIAANTETDNTGDQHILPPTMSSPGSHRLFVPDPLEDR